MSADVRFISPRMNITGLVDEIVVANIIEAPFEMPLAYGLYVVVSGNVAI